VDDNTVLKVCDLVVHYGNFVALHDISFEVERRQVVSILGPNAAGKSTLLKAIAGVLRPERGTIEFNGETLNSLRSYEIVARGISLVPEGRRIFPRLTVLENLLIGSYTPRSRNQKDLALAKAHKLFPILEERSSQLGGSLSGGEQQMLAIARSLMSNPIVLLLDDFSLGLSPAVIKSVYRGIVEINEAGTTVILVDQDIKRSLHAAHETLVMREGKIALRGYGSTLTHQEVRKAYLGHYGDSH